MSTEEPPKGLQIIELRARNVKRVKAVLIRPSEDVVVISGANGQGKSSVIDCIAFALGGKAAAKLTTRPVRDGADTASVRLDLGEFVVERTWKGTNSKLTVTAADGAPIGKAQTFLDERVGVLNFDPLGFTRMKPVEQREALLETVTLPFDPEDLERRRAGLYEQRHGIGQTLSTAKAELAGMTEPSPNTPDAEVSMTDLMARIEEAEAINRDYDQAESAEAVAAERVHELRAALEAAQETLAQAKVNRGLAPAPIVTADLRDQLANAETTNREVRAKAAYVKAKTTAAAQEQAVRDLTASIEALDTAKAEGIKAAKMPLPELGFDEDGVTYKGVPFGQASGAEQLRVSLGIAMAGKTEIRVISIKDGSLLDSTSMAIVREEVAAKGHQLWIEVVDETGDGAYVIEDGEVVGGDTWDDEPGPGCPTCFRRTGTATPMIWSETTQTYECPADHDEPGATA